MEIESSSFRRNDLFALSDPHYVYILVTYLTYIYTLSAVPLSFSNGMPRVHRKCVDYDRGSPSSRYLKYIDYKLSERACPARLQFEHPREREMMYRDAKAASEKEKGWGRERERKADSQDIDPIYGIFRAPFLSPDRSQPRLRPFVITWRSAIVKGTTATGCLRLGRPHLDRPLTRSTLGRRTRRDALADAIVRQNAVLGTKRLGPVMVICKTGAIGRHVSLTRSMREMHSTSILLTVYYCTIIK